ncbi:type I-G CRISPR-associated protein, Cas3-extension family [Micromonospora sp. NPDC004704]
MTYTVELAALDGRDALGFLASLGVVRLLRDEARVDARLSYDETSGCALLHSPLATVEEIVDALVPVIGTIPDDGVIPSVPAIFPLSKIGVAPDPMRVPREEFRTLVRDLVGRHPEPALSRWLSVLVTDLAVDAKGRAALTPFTAPAGQQSLRSLFSKPLEEVRKDPPTLIREGLTRWRRVDGYTGEYLDHRVLRSAADHPSGASVEAGVPGATWLAIMALPLLRLSGNGITVQATLWHSVPGRRQPVMTWPLWRQPLDTSGITTLLEHPDVRPGAVAKKVTVSRSCWQPLGIFAVAGAARRPIEGRKSAGVLAPIPIRTTTGR